MGQLFAYLIENINIKMFVLVNLLLKKKYDVYNFRICQLMNIIKIMIITENETNLLFLYLE